MGPRGRCQWERRVEWRRTGSRCRRDTIKKSSSHAFVRRQPAHELSRFPHTRRFLEKPSLAHCRTHASASLPRSTIPFRTLCLIQFCLRFFFALSSISTTINMYKICVYIYIYIFEIFEKAMIRKFPLFSSLEETKIFTLRIQTERFCGRVDG